MSWLSDVFDSAGRFIARNAGRVARGALGAAGSLLDPALYIISRMRGGDNDPILTAAIQHRDWKLIGMRVGSWIAAGAIEYGTAWLTALAAAGATAVGTPVAGFLAGAAVFTAGTAVAAGAVEAGSILMREDFKQRYPAEYRRMIENGTLQRNELDEAALRPQAPTNVATLDSSTRAYPSLATQTIQMDRPIHQVASQATPPSVVRRDIAAIPERVEERRISPNLTA